MNMNAQEAMKLILADDAKAPPARSDTEVNFDDPAEQERARSLIAGEIRRCACGRIFDLYPGPRQAGRIKIEGHCGTPGHNLYIFTVTAEDLQ